VANTNSRNGIGQNRMRVFVSRYALILVSIVAAGVGVVALYTSRMPVLYRSTASVLIESREPTITGTPMTANDSLPPEAGKAQRVIAESQPVLRRISDSTGIAIKPASPQVALPNGFETRIEGQLLYLSVNDTDPVRAAELANSWAAAFVEKMKQRAPSLEAQKVLEKSVPLLQKRWLEKQEQLGQFERENKFVAGEIERSPAWRTVEELSARLNSKNIELSTLLAERDVLSASESAEEILQLPRAQGDVRLSSHRRLLEERRARWLDARERFKPGAPEIDSASEGVQFARRELEESAKTLLKQVSLAVQQIENERNRLASLLKFSETQLSELKANSATYKILRSEESIAERLYSEAVQRKGEVDMSRGFENFYAVPWEQATVSRLPYLPNWPRNLVFGFLLSVFLGIGATRFIASFDDTVTMETLSTDLAAPAIGVVSHVKHKVSNKNSFALAQTQTGSILIQQLQNICADLEMRLDNLRLGESLAIVVTSSKAGEGKSFVASNLATTFAATGRRVLLVDADSQQQTLSCTFDDGIGKGFYDLLKEGLSAPIHLADGPVPGCKLLRAGKTSTVTSIRPFALQALLRVIKSEFDVVIFDTPPVLARSEATVLAQFCDATLVLARARYTRTSELSGAVERLQAAQANKIHVVFNGAPAMPVYAQPPRVPA
jgi:polysaccharide biosynthesis transport protein